MRAQGAIRLALAILPVTPVQDTPVGIREVIPVATWPP